MKVSDTFVTRFWSKVNVRREDECWLWKGAVNNKGYGTIRSYGERGPVLYVHRVAVALQGFVIRAGKMVHHTCGNRRCVNPKHLEVVTFSVNNRGENRGNGEVLHGGEPLELDLSEKVNSGERRGE